MSEVIAKVTAIDNGRIEGELIGNLIRCDDCEYSYTEGFVHPHLICEKHPELGSVADDWFCADGWKA